MKEQEIDEFLKEVEVNKMQLAKCGWIVQDDSFIVRAVKIINELRKGAKHDKNDQNKQAKH